MLGSVPIVGAALADMSVKLPGLHTMLTMVVSLNDPTLRIEVSHSEWYDAKDCSM